MSQSLALAIMFEAKAERFSELLSALVEVAEHAEREEGCELFRVHRVPGQDHTLYVYEAWASEESLQLHQGTPRSKALTGKLDLLLVKTPSYLRLNPLGEVKSYTVD